MEDWSHRNEIFMAMSAFLGTATIGIFIMIFLRKWYLQIKKYIWRKYQLRYIGIIVNALDSKMHGEKKLYSLYLGLLQAKSKKKFKRMILGRIRRDFKATISGSYGTEASLLFDVLNVKAAKQRDSLFIRIVSFPIGLVRILRSRLEMRRNHVNADCIVSVLELDKIPNVEFPKGASTKWHQMKVLHVLKTLPKDRVPDLTPALFSNQKEVCSCAYEFVALLRLDEYLKKMLVRIDAEKGTSKNILLNSIRAFQGKESLMAMKDVILGPSSFETKRLLVEHIKNECLKNRYGMV